MNGETVYVGNTAVDNVLVHNGEFQRGHLAVTDISKPVGTNVDYTLYFPMTYTDDLTGKHITVRGYDCKVLGHPDHERPKQVFGRWLGKWDMMVHVERTLAEFAETIQVLKTVVTRDTMGNRTKQTVELYNGSGQARKQSENESNGKKGTLENETWFFIVPWLDDYKTAQTQQLTIVFESRTYDVVQVLDHNWEHNYASIKAVWHG